MTITGAKRRLLQAAAHCPTVILALAILAGASDASAARTENAGAEHSQDKVVLYPAPPEEKLSADFELTVNGRRVPVYACRVSAVPLNQVWPGYQRPINQSELGSFASWDMMRPVSVVIVARELVRTVAVRPSSYAVRPAVEGQAIRFDLDRPRQLVVEVNGAHHALHLFANVVFDNCDIVRTTHIALDIQHGDRAMVKDIRFQDIRVEVDDWNPKPLGQRDRGEKYVADPKNGYCPLLLVIDIHTTFYSKDEDRGNVRNILFKDIAVTGKPFPSSYFRGSDKEHTVEGVVIENLRINGRRAADPRGAHLFLDQHVRDVRFAP